MENCCYIFPMAQQLSLQVLLLSLYSVNWFVALDNYIHIYSPFRFEHPLLWILITDNDFNHTDAYNLSIFIKPKHEWDEDCRLSLKKKRFFFSLVPQYFAYGVIICFTLRSFLPSPSCRHNNRKSLVIFFYRMTSVRCNE
jgi:hypothetical protein